MPYKRLNTFIGHFLFIIVYPRIGCCNQKSLKGFFLSIGFGLFIPFASGDLIYITVSFGSYGFTIGLFSLFIILFCDLLLFISISSANTELAAVGIGYSSVVKSYPSENSFVVLSWLGCGVSKNSYLLLPKSLI